MTARALTVRRGPDLSVPPEDRARNLVDLVWRTVDAHGQREALRWKAPGDGWISQSYAALGERIARTSLALRALGVGPGTRVAIVSGSRPEWLVSDLASLALGAVTCPIHPAESTDVIRFMLNNVRAEVVLVECREELAKIRAVRSDVPSIRELLVLDEDRGSTDAATHLVDLVPETVSGDALEAWKAGWAAIGPDREATIVHTSGTTDK